MKTNPDSVPTKAEPAGWQAALQSLPVPPPRPAAQARALELAQEALREAARASASAEAQTPLWAALWHLLAPVRWQACAALVLAMLGLGFYEWQSGPAAVPPLSREAQTRLLAELETLFPEQVNGVVTTVSAAHPDRAELRVELSGEPAAASASQPVVLTVRRGGGLVQVLGYSGRRVSVPLDGRTRTLEPLVTASGAVIVTGEDFLWTEAQPNGNPPSDGLVAARTL